MPSKPEGRESPRLIEQAHVEALRVQPKPVSRRHPGRWLAAIILALFAGVALNVHPAPA